MKLTIKDADRRGFGYDQNGDPIDESMVEELYRIAENEILPNSRLYREFGGDFDISEDSFEYYATGTAFGAQMSYIINAQIKSYGNEIIDVYDFVIKEYLKDEIHLDYSDPEVMVYIDFDINVNTDNCDTVINRIYVYNHGRYNEYDSDVLSRCFDYEKFGVYMNSIANELAEEIHAKLSNI